MEAVNRGWWIRCTVDASRPGYLWYLETASLITGAYVEAAPIRLIWVDTWRRRLGALGPRVDSTSEASRLRLSASSNAPEP